MRASNVLRPSAQVRIMHGWKLVLGSSPSQTDRKSTSDPEEAGRTDSVASTPAETFVVASQHSLGHRERRLQRVCRTRLYGASLLAAAASNHIVSSGNPLYSWHGAILHTSSSVSTRLDLPAAMGSYHPWPCSGFFALCSESNLIRYDVVRFRGRSMRSWSPAAAAVIVMSSRGDCNDKKYPDLQVIPVAQLSIPALVQKIPKGSPQGASSPRTILMLLMGGRGQWHILAPIDVDPCCEHSFESLRRRLSDYLSI
ncbi:hypothetical protein B0H11DRAFT_23810 [Mycena galericulata]|nr:hypothetical protein B0H11DRAFT_23810 [Mycena galericulata]